MFLEVINIKNRKYLKVDQNINIIGNYPLSKIV